MMTVMPGDEEEPGELVEHRADHLRGRAHIAEVQDEDGRPGFVLQGKMLTHGSLAIVTIMYNDQADHAWAREVFRSLNHPPQRTED